MTLTLPQHPAVLFDDFAPQSDGQYAPDVVGIAADFKIKNASYKMEPVGGSWEISDKDKSKISRKFKLPAAGGGYDLVAKESSGVTVKLEVDRVGKTKLKVPVSGTFKLEVKSKDPVAATAAGADDL